MWMIAFAVSTSSRETLCITFRSCRQWRCDHSHFFFKLIQGTPFHVFRLDESLIHQRAMFSCRKFITSPVKNQSVCLFIKKSSYHIVSILFYIFNSFIYILYGQEFRATSTWLQFPVADAPLQWTLFVLDMTTLLSLYLNRRCKVTWNLYNNHYLFFNFCFHHIIFCSKWISDLCMWNSSRFVQIWTFVAYTHPIIFTMKLISHVRCACLHRRYFFFLYLWSLSVVAWSISIWPMVSFIFLCATFHQLCHSIYID